MPNLWRMKRRLLVLVLALGVAATPALGDDADEKRAVDDKIAALSASLAEHRRSEATLQREIDEVTSRIRGLEARVGDVSAQLWTLEQDLALHRERLQKLNRLYNLQTARLILLRKQYRIAVDRLDRRLVAIYVNGRPTLLEFFLGARSIDDLLDQVRYVNLIGQQDRAIATEVAAAKAAMRASREKTRDVRKTVLSAQRVIAARAEQVRETRSALVGARDMLNATKSQKAVALSELSAEARAEAEEIDGLRATSAALAERIRAAQASSSVVASSSSASPSSAGLIWPVSGSLTSSFGWRWGRMHEGIDIAAPSGTGIYASASGTVIACGWMGGYGNLVVIDHGGGLATAYGHQSSIAVGCGQSVSRGQLIGYVGSTGNSTGPHVHFEVRVGGGAVDPLGYL
jgi:murein DD-endopeptidase MepM/ murein hydrolase activator NlpD